MTQQFQYAFTRKATLLSDKYHISYLSDAIICSKLSTQTIKIDIPFLQQDNTHSSVPIYMETPGCIGINKIFKILETAC